VGGQTWLLAWEIVFFLLAFLFIAWLLSLMARLWVQGTDLDWERKIIQRKALSAASRNLLLVPVAMIYVVVAVRYALR
jgi:hypothetical protein